MQTNLEFAMRNAALRQAVEQFATLTQNISDEQLERPWAWQSYDSEGIRFAFFRTYEELRELAVRLVAERMAQGNPLSQAQQILGHYHAAYWDLQAALLGLNDAQIDQAPGDNEWPVRKVLAHMLGADVGFYVVVRYALDRHRNGDERPAEFSQEDKAIISGVDEEKFNGIMAGSLENICAWHRTFHGRILEEFAEIGDAELELPSTFWEDESMSLRFRLHRFDSHMRQHTIQVDKTRIALKQSSSEAMRLLRLIYAALATVEGTLMAAWQTGERGRAALAQTINARTLEIKGVLNR